MSRRATIALWALIIAAILLATFDILIWMFCHGWGCRFSGSPGLG